MLSQLSVTLLDCQTTGASPARGDLLELVWGVAGPDEAGELQLESLGGGLVELAQGQHIPRRVQQITGIDVSMVRAQGLPAAQLWEELQAQLSRSVLAVIHYARFERPFLEQLALEQGAQELGARIICTHEIARRLYPALPRRGIRAIAGYLGAAMLEEDKRAGAHVRATFAIWRGLIEELRTLEGIETLESLESWLESTRPRRSKERRYLVTPEQRLSLPRGPGIYRMRAARDAVLYVGKATNLRARVNSYFRGKKNKAEKTLEFVSQVHRLEVERCETAIEAALLESDEIKRWEPPYNIALRDRDRAIGFVCPRSLDRDDPGASQTPLLGPALHPEAIQQWGPLLGRPIRAELFAIDARSPELEVLEEAYQLTGQRLGLGSSVRLEELLQIGERMWIETQRRRHERALEKERLAALAEEEQGEEEEAAAVEDEEVEERLGFEERVELHLVDPQYWSWQIERSIASGSRQLRRARFLMQLSCASLWFVPPEREEDQARRLLVLQDAELIEARWMEEEEWLEASGSLRRGSSLRVRQAAMSLADYDRLSVLAGELRRLLQDPGVRLGVERGGMRLDPEALRRWLWWF